MTYDKKFLLWALAYAAIGMVLGIYMAASHDHVQHVTHAHVLLVGFTVSFIYAVVHRLWLNPRGRTLPTVQLFLHQSGAVVLLAGLFTLHGGLVPEAQVGPILGVASIAVLAGLLLMVVMVIKPQQA